MSVLLPEIIVTDRGRAARLLLSRSRRGHLRHVISIGDPNDKPPGGLHAHPARRLRLLFDDVERDWQWYTAATTEQVQQIIDFCRLIPAGETTLIHCAAGVSRSTAAALILLTLRRGPGEERAAVAELDALIRAAHEQRLRADLTVLPNRRLIWLADGLLGRGGALQAAYRERWKLHSEPEL